MINISIKKPKPVLVMVHNASKGLRGVGLSGVTLDKDGNLIFTMSDGTVQTIKGYSQDLVNTTNKINNIKKEVSTIANNAANSAKEAKETADSIKQEYDRVEGATNSGLALIERSVLYGINRVKEATKACKSDALANIELAHKDAIDDIAIRRWEALQDISKANTSAASSAVAAKTSETNAKTSETNAKTSETNAKTSETNAKTSETNAETSNQMAKKWAESTESPDGATDSDSPTGNTQSSKSWALHSKSNASAAKASETNAKTSETNAAKSATSASNSATSAASYATAAKNSATAAATSATNANNSETQAYEYKASASDSATAAASSASSASTSATNAKAAMNTANTAASSASTSATNASTSASNASKSEIAAKTAQVAAEKARDDANSAVTKLTGVMKYAGQVNNYSDLADVTKNNGDVWNIVNADSEHGIKAGDNVTWNGTDWDNLSGVVDLSAYAEKADYQKAITSATANGDTITFNHKDGTTSTATVNNVASATVATNDAKGQKIDTTYEKIADASNAHTSLQNSINTKLDKTGGTATGAIVAPSFQTGNGANNYFQCQKFRGEGDANTYYHAIDFGYGGHDQVDFYEYGGIWNFHRCQSGNPKTSKLVGSITDAGWDGLVKGQDITTYAKKSDLSSSLSTKALTVTGETSVPTANEGNSSNTIASTEFVAKSLAKMVDSAPESLNTLNELAKALGDDPNFATTMVTELGKKANTADVANTYLDKLTTTVQKVTAPIQYTGTPSSNDELVNKSYVDSTVKTAVDNEASARSSADNTLAKKDLSNVDMSAYVEKTDYQDAITSLQNSINTKQNTLTFDSTPTANSSNPVTSDGIKKAIDAKTVDLSNYYTKTQVDTAISKKANTADVANTYLDKLSKTEQVVTAPIKGTLNGNAASATKLANARTINVTDADGTNTGTGASFNGSGNATIKLPAKIKATLNGNADTATKATQDASGNDIQTTYVKQGGMNLWNALHNNKTSNLQGLTNAQWNALGFFIRYFSTNNNFENQPSQYGQLINISADKGSESTQLFIEQSSGKIYFRGGNADNAMKDVKFKAVAYWDDDGHLKFPNGAEMWVY